MKIETKLCLTRTLDVQVPAAIKNSQVMLNELVSALECGVPDHTPVRLKDGVSIAFDNLDEVTANSEVGLSEFLEAVHSEAIEQDADEIFFYV